MTLALVCLGGSTFSLFMNWLTYRKSKKRYEMAKAAEENARAIYRAAVELLNNSRKKQ